MLNLSYLRYFYICAQSGTITKAASRLQISQPSLSMQVKNFEEQLGFHLFVRTGKTLQLTPKGQGLFLYASKIFEITDDIEKFLKKSGSEQEQSLKIGVSDEVERPFIAEVVGRLIKANSADLIVPSIISKRHDEMVDLVASEEIDLVITNQKSSKLKSVNELKIPVALVSGNHLDVRVNQQLSLQNLFKMIDQKLILPTDELLLAKETSSFLKQKSLNIPTVLTSNIIACIARATQEKLGAAFLPIAYVSRELTKGSLYSYGPKEGFWQHHLYLYTYKGNNNSFVQSLSKILQDFNTLKFESDELKFV